MGADHAVSVVSGSETGPSSTGPGRRPAAPRARLPGTAELFASLVQSQRQVTGTDGMEAGDYTLRVTVIEAYGLAAKDKSGTSDPYVVASVGTERQRTHVVRRALSCTWGTTMAFELPNMTAGRAELLSIRFKVRDADTLTSELIGTCELEIAHVWQKPNHAVWHTWMALFSGEEVESTRGVASGRITRGYLRVSAAMLGPGRQMVMPLEPPRTNELRGVLISPNIRMTFGALFLDVLSVIGLKPLVPSSTQLRVSVQLRFAGIEVRTQANRVDVTDAVLTEVSFEQRLRLPLSLPSIADRIELTIVDDSSKAILASTTISLVLTERKARGEFKSVQLYGAAIGSKQAVADGMAHGEVQPTAWRATARCRIYRKLNGEADVRRALGGALGAVEGLRNTRIVEAEKGAFALLVRVFSATGVPASGVFSISVQLAHVEMDTRLVPSAGARAVEWNQPLALAAELPIERASQPDVFVSLRGPLRQLLAIARVPVAELGQMRPDEAELGYVRPRPRWLTLARVDASGALLPAVAGVGAETVELLLETHFGRENPRAGPFEAGPPERPPVLMAAKLKLLLFGAEGLPATDESGAASCFVLFRCGGCETSARSAVRAQTSVPGWFETLSLQLPLPVDRLLWPIATVEVWATSTLGSDTLLGIARIATSEAASRVQPRAAGALTPPQPEWYSLERPATAISPASSAPATVGRSRLDDAPRSEFGAVLLSAAVEEAASAAFFYAQATDRDENKRLKFGDRTAGETNASSLGLGGLGALGRGLGLGGWFDTVPRTVRQADPLVCKRVACIIELLVVGVRLNGDSARFAQLKNTNGDFVVEVEVQAAFGPPVRCQARLSSVTLAQHVRVRIPALLPADPTLCPSLTVRLREARAQVLGSGPVLATGALPLRAPLAHCMARNAGREARQVAEVVEAQAAAAPQLRRMSSLGLGGGVKGRGKGEASLQPPSRSRRRTDRGVESALEAMATLHLRALPIHVQIAADPIVGRRSRPGTPASRSQRSSRARLAGDLSTDSESSGDEGKQTPAPPPRRVPPLAAKVASAEQPPARARGRSPFRITLGKRPASAEPAPPKPLDPTAKAAGEGGGCGGFFARLAMRSPRRRAASSSPLRAAVYSASGPGLPAKRSRWLGVPGRRRRRSAGAQRRESGARALAGSAARAATAPRLQAGQAGGGLGALPSFKPRVFWEGDLAAANEQPSKRSAWLPRPFRRQLTREQLAAALPPEATAPRAADKGGKGRRRQSNSRRGAEELDALGSDLAAKRMSRGVGLHALARAAGVVASARRRREAAEEEEDEEDGRDGAGTAILSAAGEDEEDEGVRNGRHMHPVNLEEMTVPATGARLIRPPYSSRPFVVRSGGGLLAVASLKYTLAVVTAAENDANTDALESQHRARAAETHNEAHDGHPQAAAGGRNGYHLLASAPPAGGSGGSAKPRPGDGVSHGAAVWHVPLVRGLGAADGVARVFIRVYVLRGHSLSRTRTPGQLRGGLSGLGIFPSSHVAWMAGEAAPTGLSTYLSVSHGGKVHADRARAVKGTFEPHYYQSFELEAQLPGDGRVRIAVVEAGAVPLLDEELGATELDVEDRWFSKAWVESKPKPVEKRVLYRETSSAAQGALDVLVEVLSFQEHKASPYKQISLPPPEEFEVRLIIFETHRLRKLGIIRNTDPYFRCRLVGHGATGQSQETDVHWGVLDGTALYNWRFIFRLTLPLSSRRSLDGLHVELQAWDHALVGEGEVIASSRLDVSQLCRDAWHRREDLKRKDSSLTHPRQSSSTQRFSVDLAPTNATAADELRPAGEVIISLEIMPIEVAKKRPSGQGRDPPNRYPVLPEPQRMQSKGFSDRFASIMRDEMRLSMAESVREGIRTEYQQQLRQLTPERIRLGVCAAASGGICFALVIIFQFGANIVIFAVFAQNEAVFNTFAAPATAT